MTARRRRVLIGAVSLLVALLASSPALSAGTTGTTGTDAPATDELAESSAALLKAQDDLARAKADLAKVEAELIAAQEKVRTSRVEADAARQALHAAVLAEEKTRGEIDGLRDEIDRSRGAIGEVARQAYRGSQFATLSVVLEAETPTEFADRLVSIRTVLRSEESALAEMAASRGELAEREYRLTSLRELQERLTAESERKLAEAQAAEDAARVAQQSVAAVVARRKAALAAAEHARNEDIARYRTFVTQAGALGTILVDASKTLQQRGTSVNGTGLFVRPGTGQITSAFGARFHPVLNYVKMHTGLDLGAGNGRVYAADDGVVVLAGEQGGYGNLVAIDHGIVAGKRTATMYAHQSSYVVKPGDKVVKGQQIGFVGSTGMSTGPHIHFEVRVDGAPVDPAPWLLTAPGPVPSPTPVKR